MKKLIFSLLLVVFVQISSEQITTEDRCSGEQDMKKMEDVCKKECTKLGKKVFRKQCKNNVIICDCAKF